VTAPLSQTDMLQPPVKSQAAQASAQAPAVTHRVSVTKQCTRLAALEQLALPQHRTLEPDAYRNTDVCPHIHTWQKGSIGRAVNRPRLDSFAPYSHVPRSGTSRAHDLPRSAHLSRSRLFAAKSAQAVLNTRLSSAL
jgi:hypothetical protein